jgi:hypothetical protein
VRRAASTELAAWVAATEVLDVPAELARLMADHRAALGELERVTDALRDLEAAPSVSARLSAGVEPETAVADADEDAAAAERTRKVVEEVTSFVASKERAVRRWIAAHRSALIADTLGPAVAELLDEAAPLVATLADYAPTFDDRSLVAKATPAELKAYRALEVLDDRLADILTAYLRTWMAATALTGGAGGEKWPGWLRPSRAGGLHVWAAPELVDDLDVAYGADRRLVAVTYWHAQGGRYRLTTGRELSALDRKVALERPWGARRQIAGILMPGASRSERFERAERKRPRFVAL